LDEFLEYRFGNEAGIACVKRETFYDWKRKFKEEGKIDY
jgi:transposase